MCVVRVVLQTHPGKCIGGTSCGSRENDVKLREERKKGILEEMACRSHQPDNKSMLFCNALLGVHTVSFFVVVVCSRLYSTPHS